MENSCKNSFINIDHTWKIEPSLDMSVVNSTLFSTYEEELPICKLKNGSAVQGIAIRICKGHKELNKFIFIGDNPILRVRK